MVQPYTAVGLIPTVRGVRKRAEIERRLEPVAPMVAAASWLSSLDLLARLVAVPERAPGLRTRHRNSVFCPEKWDSPRFFRKRTDP